MESLELVRGSTTLPSPGEGVDSLERWPALVATVPAMDSGRRVMVSIQLLGAPEIRVGPHVVPTHRHRKALELLALLCLRPAGVDRAVAAGTLWPESTTRDANASLRQAIRQLRTLLGRAAWRLLATRLTVALDVSGAAVDILEFDASLKRGDERSLARAVELYRGELLEGWDGGWMAEQRRRRHQACLNTIDRLVPLLVENGTPETAEPYLAEALELEPCHESAAYALMALHSAAGRHLAAIGVYRALRKSLAVDHDAPSTSVEALYQRIRARDAAVARRTVSRDS